MKLLWIPHTGWHIPQRAHLFCRLLSERHEVHVTDWVADFIHLPDFISFRYLRNFSYRRYHDGNITVHGVPRIAPALYWGFLRRVNTRIFERLVRRLIDRYCIDVVVGTFVLPPPEAGRLIFDLFDDNVASWRCHGKYPAYADEIEAVEAAYLQKADAVVAVSSVLVEKAHSYNPRGKVYHIPNGVELGLYQGLNRRAWRDRLGLRGKVVGVVGNHDKLEELSKVLYAAESLKHAGVTFVVAGRGSALPFAERMAGEKGLDNIRFLGALPRKEVPSLLAALDVGLCPYTKTPGDDARCPIRLLEYSAAGLPIVCTNLEEVQRMAFPNVVLVDDDLEAFVKGVLRSFSLPRRRPDEFTEYDLARLVPRFEAVLKGD